MTAAAEIAPFLRPVARKSKLMARDGGPFRESWAKILKAFSGNRYKFS